MPAYLIADIEVTDDALFAQYRQLVPETVAAYGGKYLARGGEAHPLEGDADLSRRRVIIEFESVERAKAWHASPEYARPKNMRARAANSNVIIVDGV